MQLEQSIFSQITEMDNNVQNFLKRTVKTSLKTVDVEKQTVNSNSIEINGSYSCMSDSPLPVSEECSIANTQAGTFKLNFFSQTGLERLVITRTMTKRKHLFVEQMVIEESYYVVDNVLINEFKTIIKQEYECAVKTFEGTGYYYYMPETDDLVKYAQKEYEYITENGQEQILKDTYLVIKDIVRTR